MPTTLPIADDSEFIRGQLVRLFANLRSNGWRLPCALFALMRQQADLNL